MSDKLLFWAERATEFEEENKLLEQRINLLQIAGDEAIKQRNDALRERDEARAEVEELREALEKSLTILPSCTADCKKPLKEALKGGENDES